MQNLFIENFDISKITWFRTGGKVKLFAKINNEEELQFAVKHFIDNFVKKKEKKITDSFIQYKIYIS